MTSPLASAAAASALAALLPSAAPLETTQQPGGPAPSGAVGVGVDFVGAVSAELAMVLSPRAEAAVRAAGGAGTVALADVMRPAFEAGTAEFGSGVLGEVSERDTGALFTDPEAAVFRFTDDAGQEPFAWLAMRIRHSAAKGHTELTANKLGRIHDVEMALSVVIGRTRMSVANVLGLEPGNVVDLDRSAGSPADVLLNGRLIAHGEVVVVDQDYAVRITKILDTAETVG
jgi:flagellar motor switch protein FliN